MSCRRVMAPRAAGESVLPESRAYSFGAGPDAWLAITTVRDGVAWEALGLASLASTLRFSEVPVVPMDAARKQLRDLHDHALGYPRRIEQQVAGWMAVAGSCLRADRIEVGWVAIAGE